MKKRMIRYTEKKIATTLEEFHSLRGLSAVTIDSPIEVAVSDGTPKAPTFRYPAGSCIVTNERRTISWILGNGKQIDTPTEQVVGDLGAVIYRHGSLLEFSSGVGKLIKASTEMRGNRIRVRTSKLCSGERHGYGYHVVFNLPNTRRYSRAGKFI